MKAYEVLLGLGIGAFIFHAFTDQNYKAAIGKIILQAFAIYTYKFMSGRK